MISIFNGQKRGPGSADQSVFVQLDVKFRNCLHVFSGAELYVFLAIALHINEDGISWPSYDTLQKETGYGRATISKALSSLCELKIDDHPVLMRWRVRDDDGKYTGSNHYKLFPTPEEIQSSESVLVQSSVIPTLDESNCGQTELEEKPVTKEEPESKDSTAPASGAGHAPQTDEPEPFECGTCGEPMRFERIGTPDLHGQTLAMLFVCDECGANYFDAERWPNTPEGENEADAAVLAYMRATASGETVTLEELTDEPEPRFKAGDAVIAENIEGIRKIVSVKHYSETFGEWVYEVNKPSRYDDFLLCVPESELTPVPADPPTPPDAPPSDPPPEPPDEGPPAKGGKRARRKAASDKPPKPDYWGDFLVEVSEAFNEPIGKATKIAEQMLGVAPKGDRATHNCSPPAQLGQARDYVVWYKDGHSDCDVASSAEALESWWHKFQQAGAPKATQPPTPPPAKLIGAPENVDLAASIEATRRKLCQPAA